MRNTKKQIFPLFSCDVWKGADSMRLMCACSTPTKVRNAIGRAISNGDIGYGYDESATAAEMVKQFKEDWKLRTRADINDRMIGGFFDYTIDGEVYE